MRHSKSYCALRIHISWLICCTTQPPQGRDPTVLWRRDAVQAVFCPAAPVYSASPVGLFLGIGPEVHTPDHQGPRLLLLRAVLPAGVVLLRRISENVPFFFAPRPLRLVTTHLTAWVEWTPWTLCIPDACANLRVCVLLYLDRFVK